MKLYSNQGQTVPIRLLKKVFNIMKITVVLCLLATFCTFASVSYSQTIEISLNLQDVTLQEALDAVKEQTEFSFWYRNEEIDLSKKISLKIKRKNIHEIMSQLLSGQNLVYTIDEKHIIIYKKDVGQQEHEQKRVSGSVTDQNGEPIAGVNIVEKGTTNGTVTDVDGNFILSVSTKATLMFSYIGYVSREIEVTGKSDINVSLVEDNQALDEIVVVGYGAVKKKDLSGAISSVKGDDLISRKTMRLSSALQGAVAGVLVTRNGNEPGQAGDITIRGVTTIGDSSPLVIIDGVPGDINTISPNDVENISVLKDAASASIYGARAASGVLLVTTKRAEENDLSLSYNFEYGWELPTGVSKYVGTQRYLEMENEMYYNDNPDGGWYQTYSEDQVNNWMKYNSSDPVNYPNTSWKDWLLKSSAPRQTHTINIAGGSKKILTKASFTYNKAEGLYYNRSFENYIIRVNNDFRINKYLSASLDFNFKREKNLSPQTNPYTGINVSPIYPVLYPDGRYAVGIAGNKNYYAGLMDGGTNTIWDNEIGGKATLDFTPFKGLKVSGVIAPNYSFDKIKSFRKAVPYTTLDDPNTTAGYFSDFETTKLSENRNDNYNYTVQFIANYINTFGKHNINIMAGYENYYSFWEKLGASRDQYELTNYPYLDIGPNLYRDNNGSAGEYAYRSWFGRVMYNFDNKYMFQANIRRDGSSRFASTHRWGTFPSFSAGWVISEEPFMRDLNIEWLSFLKLRGSWGELGNERIGEYPYVGLISFNNSLFYQNGSVVSELTAAQIQYAIKSISWEKTQSFDIGLDATFFDNRLRFTGDYYKKKTRDMLLSVEIPSYVGYDNPSQNAGKMYTRGYDIELAWNDMVGDWRYGVSVNLSDFVSKMGNLSGTEFLGSQVKKEGSQFNEWYGYLSDGLFLSQEEIDDPSTPLINGNVKVGDIKYKDISGPDGVPDGKISPEYDRVLLGGSLPRYIFGGRINVGYKNLDLSLAFQGVGSQNVKVPLQSKDYRWGLNFPSMLDGKYWSSTRTNEENAKAIYPRLTDSNYESNMTMSDFWLFNGRYLRLKNLTVGYSLPSTITQKASISKIRFYVSANDLFCIDKYPEGSDPESSGGSYPITTSLLFGISVNF